MAYDDSVGEGIKSTLVGWQGEGRRRRKFGGAYVTVFLSGAT
jgi:hypothetical protein